MRRVIFYLIILLISILVGVKIARDPGYFLFSYNNWTVEMTLWFAALMLLLIFVLFYFTLRLWRGIRNIPVHWQLRSQRRHSDKLLKFSNQGFLSLVTGDWNTAQQQLLKAAPHSKVSWLYYLAIAFAADKVHNPRIRDAYLQKASSINKETKIAVGILQAQTQIQKQPVQAIALLEHLRQEAPKQPYILRLLVQAYEKLQDWHHLLALLPALKKLRVFSPSEFETVQVIAYRGMLHSAEYNNPAGLRAIWKQIPKSLHENPALVDTYAQLLIAKGANGEAENLLSTTLVKTWDDRLISLYGRLLSNNPHQQLATAEKWLEHHKNDATLLFNLGIICLRCQLWGKARHYFEASISVEPRQETYLELGKLLESLGEDPNNIVQCYKHGLQSARAV